MVRTSRCTCGQVVFEAEGEPILSGVCYCDDCQAGARALEALPNAARALDDDGGASYLTYRDDRWTCVKGAHLLDGHKLRDNSPTVRHVATCCNAPMFLKYKRGHWVSTYRRRFVDDDLPTVEMRTNTRFRTASSSLPDDAPSYRRFPIGLFGKLVMARVNMMLGR